MLEEIEVVFISWDEANADEHYDILLKECPTAKRVKGVLGIELAHHKAGLLSQKPWTMTIDGDNIVHKNFLDNIEIPSPGTMISYTAVNPNGVENGNGGIKIFPTEFLTKAVPPMTAGEFVWDLPCKFINKSLSTCEYGEHQAWRVGLREGFKCSRGWRGTPVPSEKVKHGIHWPHLLLWCNKGDAWSRYGALCGAVMSVRNTATMSQIQDYTWTTSLKPNEVDINRADYMASFLNEAYDILPSETGIRNWI